MKIINKAIEVLKNGGVILYPTDTIWGIGCDATNEKAVEKIYQIKERDESKALITLVGSCNQLLDYTKIKSKEAKNSSPTTIIYPNVSASTLNNLVKELKHKGNWYTYNVNKNMYSSYAHSARSVLFAILDVLVSSVGLRCLFKYGQRRNRQTRQPNIDIVRCHCIYVYIYIYI